MTERRWTVQVDDNFHYMDISERYCAGEYDDYAAAVACCKSIVDDFLHENDAVTAENLFDSWFSFGEDPWIEGMPPVGCGAPFSAMDYVRQRCAELRPDTGRQSP